jgi:AraC-like DNA-binding protein
MTTDLKPYFKDLIDLYLDFPKLKITHMKPFLADRLIMACKPEDFAYFNVNWLARVLEVDVSFLSKHYKKFYKQTVQQSITSQKMWWAARLLVEYQDMSISQLAEKLDYCNANYFIKVFKKNRGITPLQFKIKMKDQPPEVKSKFSPTKEGEKVVKTWFRCYDLMMEIRKINIQHPIIKLKKYWMKRRRRKRKRKKK